MRKILHLNAGNETGGGMHHILGLLGQFNREEFVLGVLEKGELLERANALGIETVYFENHTRMSIPLIHKISNYIKHEKVSCVHTHGPRANVYANILKKLTRFNWIVTVHSDPEHDFMGKGLYGDFLARLNLGAIRNADRIIAISDRFRSNLAAVGVHSEKIITALNGIDFEKKLNDSYLRKDFGIDDGDFLILKVARFEPVKGHEIALEAFSKVMQRRRDCHLMLLGDGSLRETIRNVASDLGVLNNVHFLGHRNDVESFYHMADITMLTSFSESFPLVLLESARAKTPIITTDVGGVYELVKNKSLGWITQPGNVNELIRAMEEALSFHGNGMLPLMGKKLHTHASTKFSLEIFAKNIYNVYSDVKNAN